jgi:hypothetical protein
MPCNAHMTWLALHFWIIIIKKPPYYPKQTLPLPFLLSLSLSLPLSLPLPLSFAFVLFLSLFLYLYYISHPFIILYSPLYLLSKLVVPDLTTTPPFIVGVRSGTTNLGFAVHLRGSFLFLLGQRCPPVFFLSACLWSLKQPRRNHFAGYLWPLKRNHFVLPHTELGL